MQIVHCFSEMLVILVLVGAQAHMNTRNLHFEFKSFLSEKNFPSLIFLFFFFFFSRFSLDSGDIYCSIYLSILANLSTICLRYPVEILLFSQVFLLIYPLLWLKLYLHLFKQRKSKLGNGNDHEKKKKKKWKTDVN